MKNPSRGGKGYGQGPAGAGRDGRRSAARPSSGSGFSKDRFVDRASGSDERPARSERPSYNDRSSRPERPSFGGDRPRGGKPSNGDRPSYGDKPRGNFGDRPAYGDKPRGNFGDRKPFGSDRPSYGDKPRGNFGDRKPFGGDRPSYGDKPRGNFGDRKPFGGDRPSYGDKPRGNFGDRKPFGGDRPSYGDKPRGDRSFSSDRPSFGDKPKGNFGDRKPFGSDRPSYGDKPRGNFGDRKPFSNDRPSYGDKPRGERPFGGKSFGDDRPRGGSYQDRPHNNDRPSRDAGDRKTFGKREGGFGDKPRGERPFGANRPERGNRDERPFNQDRPQGRGFEPRPFTPRPDRPERERPARPGSDWGTSPRPERQDRPDRGPRKGPENRDDRANQFDRPRRDDRYDKPQGQSWQDARTGFGLERRQAPTGPDRDDRPARKPTSFTDNAVRREMERSAKGKRRAEEQVDEGPLDEGDGLIRLNRFIAASGLCSRREADALIEEGRIAVNGKTVAELGHKVKPTDEVRFGGRLLRPEKNVYILINKPKNMITTLDDEEGRRTVMELVEGVVDERVYPVGRLDRNTTGLLLLTNDGDLADRLMHPSFEIRKVYQADLDQPLSDADFKSIRSGLMLEDGKAPVDDLAILSPDRKSVGIELHIGRNRIVRRIFEHLGYQVDKLDRVMYGGLTKKDLPRGKFRHLTQQEVINIKHLGK